MNKNSVSMRQSAIVGGDRNMVELAVGVTTAAAVKDTDTEQIIRRLGWYRDPACGTLIWSGDVDSSPKIVTFSA